MKIFKSIKGVTFGAFLYFFGALNAVYSDDTEIFFAKKDDTDTVTPNVLFVIDTSGSMSRYPSGSNQSRIQIVKSVMNDVLTNINDVNVGLMRYNKGDTDGDNSAEGGPILYPATFIDQPADPSVTKIIEQGNNDGSQAAPGTVTLNSQTLTLGEGADAYVAVRFESVLIPQGAKVTSANLIFTAQGDQSDAADLTLSAELSNDASALKDDNFNLSDRQKTTTASIPWLITEPWSNGRSYSSASIQSVVQEVVGQANWCGGNGMVFLIKGAGGRRVHSVEGSIANSNDTTFYPAPKLHIKFDNTLPATANGCVGIEVNSQISDRRHDWEKPSRFFSFVYNSSDLDFYQGNNNYPSEGIGLSFTRISIPRGAKIKKAYLSFTPHYNESGPGEVRINGVTQSYPGYETNYPALLNAQTSTSVDWSLKPWVRDIDERTPDISSLVQSVVNQANWSLGHTLSFFLNGVSGYHIARSYDNWQAKAPKLYVLYEGVYQPGVITKREEMKSVIAELPADGYTPISDVMAEAGLYFRGESVTYGIDRDNQSANRTSHPDSWENTGTLVTPERCTLDNYGAYQCRTEKIIGNPNYISPIKESCQTNHIVFLTDGAPTSHHQETNDAYNRWTGASCSSSNYGSDCAVKIAGFLNGNDQSATLTGKQLVKTHTIGFDIDLPLLENMATAGGGSYYTAENRDGLIDAITNIVSSIANVNTSFVSTGVSVNQYNRLTHNDELYFSLFSPASGNVWPGNVKRYKLSGGQIVDANSIAAIDPSNSQFIDSSQSWWTNEVDGSNVEKGGVAEQLGYNRKVYTNISGTDLTLGSNVVEKGNNAITLTMLGAVNSEDKNNIIDWARGLEIGSEPKKSHNIIGDPLHSQPTLVIYNNGSVDRPAYDTNVYVGTNHGFLHSFNAENGTENWSFIPQRLLGLLSDLQKENTVPHGYGLDGSISIHLTDENKNGVVDVAAGEKAYLYVGMRRGGNAYFAIDISNPDKPKFMYKIDPTTTGFNLLGDTWSKPYIGKMNIGGTAEQLVMIFGGGYDSGQDIAGTATRIDARGNRVYIANALTGRYIWDSSLATRPAGSLAGDVADMNAVPANVTAFDLDDDGLIDHFYASDTKAQIFRFDVDNSTQTIAGGKIAHLQSAADIANNRRFYYQPDIALIRLKNETFVSVSIGSGYRAHPLDESITDYFYMIKDKGVLQKNFDMNLTMNDLLDVTNLVGYDENGNSIPGKQLELTNKKGWYLGFQRVGEKVIQRSITFSNTVVFSTYIPPGNSSNICEAASGGSRMYALDIADGNPYNDNNYDGVINDADRAVDLKIPGIAPEPQILITGDPKKGLEPIICIGPECKPAPPTPKNVMGMRWRKN